MKEYECSYSDKKYSDESEYIKDVFNAPLMGCVHSNAGHCRFAFKKQARTWACAYQGDNWHWNCGKWITEPTHSSRKYKHMN